jgi:REP element-mobilizing transposase RayT
MARGIEGREIFRDESDREHFLTRLGDILSAADAPRLYAWALMTNHFHLLIQPIAVDLSTMMRRLLTGHAVRFNLRHKRHGHLFQNRYKSIVVEEESYFLELVRYIHLNPLRVGAVSSIEELEHYPYTGHSVILGNRTQQGQDVDSVLSRFSTQRATAKVAYQGFVADGIAQGRREELGSSSFAKGTGAKGLPSGPDRCDWRILGGNEFAAVVLDGGSPGQERPIMAIEDVLRTVSEQTGVAVEDILGQGRGRRASAARGIFFDRARKEVGTSLTALGKMTGRSHVAVIKAIRGR